MMHARSPDAGLRRGWGHGGFTLIELLISLAILALLATLVVPGAQVAMQRTQEQELRRALREIRQALDDYRRAADEGRVARPAGGSGYPRDLQVLVSGEPDLLDPRPGRKLYFLRRVPRDPMQPDASLGDAQTWLKRSFASESTDPREGADVYDVLSMSPRIGLNGIPYAKW